jgi:hypothetical protein
MIWMVERLLRELTSTRPVVDQRGGKRGERLLLKCLGRFQDIKAAAAAQEEDEGGGVGGGGGGGGDDGRTVLSASSFDSRTRGHASFYY